MYSLKSLSILLLFLLLSGCKEAPYSTQNSAYIVFKTERFKYADMGFIYENNERVKVEIYGSGQALMTLTLTKEAVCMRQMQCMTKATFNRKVLSRDYPEEILTHILEGKPIFDGYHKVEKRNGFTQKVVKRDKYHIEYSVLNKQILFHDTINEILIKVIKQ